MADKTFKLRINKSDGSYVDTATFTIPATAGTYALKLTLSNGTVINAGNIVVGSTAKTYRLNLTLSNGTTLNAGTFTTPTTIATFTKAFPSGVTKNVVGTKVWVEYGDYAHYGDTKTATYNYSYSTISINGITLNSTDQLVHTITTTSGSATTVTQYTAKYTGGVLTLKAGATLYNDSSSAAMVLTAIYTGTFTGI